MTKTDSQSFGPLALARPSAPSRPRASAGHRAAHAEAWPSRPTARDGGRPARADGFVETPPNYLTFTTSAKTLFTQSRLLQIRPPNFLSFATGGEASSASNWTEMPWLLG